MRSVPFCKFYLSRATEHFHFLKKKCLQFLVLVVEPDSLGRFLSVTSHNLDPVDFADFGHFAELNSGDDESPHVVAKLKI